MLHSPYIRLGKGYNSNENSISCNIPEEMKNELDSYYSKMLGNEIGSRLYERTMWYCSSSDGWVVKGSSAALLYGIAN